MKIKAYKGFDKDMKCKDFQYEVGKEYTEEKAELCGCGFHACEFPLNVFKYYPPAASRFCEVELDANEQKETDSKRVGTHIKVKSEVGLHGLIKAGVEYIKNQVDFDNEAATNTGDQSAATNTGNCSAATNTGNWSAATNTGNWSAATNTGTQSAATNTGDWSAATNTGDRSAATNTGTQSAATNTGDQSAAEVTGEESIALVTGFKSKARGSVGCFIVLADWREINGELHIVDVKSAKVDGKKIKADTWYMLVDGNFMEVEE